MFTLHRIWWHHVVYGIQQYWSDHFSLFTHFEFSLTATDQFSMSTGSLLHASNMTMLFVSSKATETAQFDSTNLCRGWTVQNKSHRDVRRECFKKWLVEKSFQMKHVIICWSCVTMLMDTADRSSPDATICSVKSSFSRKQLQNNFILWRIPLAVTVKVENSWKLYSSIHKASSLICIFHLNVGTQTRCALTEQLCQNHHYCCPLCASSRVWLNQTILLRSRLITLLTLFSQRLDE